MLNIPKELEAGSSPFVGPRPFERNDRNLFFGRDRETIQIISMILSSPLTLIYSQSGVGKTSLLNTKIMHELEEQYKFQTFPSARVRSLLAVDKIPEDVTNMYMFNALQSLKPDTSLEKLKKQTLSSFLKEYSKKTETVIQDDKSATPKVIVFDQLEELFNLYPENWHDQQQEFFGQIAEALNEDPMLRVVLVIREEYLAHLSAFADLLPGRLRSRFRLERLNKEAALLAVTEPLKQTGYFFAPGVAEKLVDDLLTMRVENIFGKTVDMKGEYVEPVYLQVVCQRLWIRIVSSAITEITQEHLKGSGDVNRALTEFYLDAIYDAAEQTGIKEDAIRKWFDEKLVTSSGTRGIVHREAESTGGISNNVVDVLQGRYLIRPEWRSGSRWYELTHDRLIQPIIESNKEWKQWKQKKKNNKVIITTGSIAATAIVVAIVVFTYYTTQTPTTTLIIDQRIVTVGESPASVAVNPNTNLIYVANRDSNTVSVIDGTTNSIKEIILVGYGPASIAVDHNTNLIYVANRDSNTVSVIDGTTNSVMHTLSMFDEIDINPNTNLIYVNNYLLDTVSIINGTTNNIAADFAVNGELRQLTVDPNTNLIYVIHQDSYTGFDTVSIINGTTNTVVQNVTVSGSAVDPDFYPNANLIAINPNTNLIYVTYYDINTGFDTLSIINGTTNTVVQNVTGSMFDEIEINPVYINPNTNLIYVTYYDINTGLASNTLSIINGTTNTVVQNVTLGGSPSAIDIHPNTNLIYVTHQDSNTLSIINGTTNSIVKDVTVGTAPSSVAINPNTSLIYVANEQDNTLSIINASSIQTSR